MFPQFPISIYDDEVQEKLDWLRKEPISFKKTPIPIRVGYQIYHPKQLGWEDYYLLKIMSEKTVYTIIYIRHNIPLIINVAEHTDRLDYIQAYNIAHSFTPSNDYPYKPILRMLEELEKQQELFFEELRKPKSFSNADLYIVDLLGILLFSLRARGVTAKNSYVGRYAVNHHIDLRELQQLINLASKPAPSLGNTMYIDIAYRAYQLLKIAYQLYKQTN